MPSLFAELKRRHVYRTAVVYAGAGWLLVQVATQVAPYFDLPNWTVRLAIVAIACGFPLALFVSWYWEWSPSGGWQRDPGAGDEVAAQPAALRGPAPENSIAVLAFVDMSEGRDQEYFSDGIAEELLNLLAQLPQLRVTARTSSFSFKGRNADVATIARALNVAHVLEGSVRKSGNRLRVTAQLIRGDDSMHAWSQTYDREMTDVFALQDEIARAVVGALEVRLLPQQRLANPHRTGNTQAYDAFLLGHAVLRRNRYEDSQQAVAAFERAIALDPDYAPAHAGLARAKAAAADYAADASQRAVLKHEALAAAERAIALAPDLADGYAARAPLRYRQFWDWQGATEDLQRALDLDGSSSDVRTQFALLLHNLGRIDEAIVYARSVTESDPLSALGWMMYGGGLRAAGDFAAARAALRHALEINPASSWARQILAGLELLDGKPQAALEVARDGGEAFRQAGIAAAEYMLGHEAESRAALAELEARYATGFAVQIAETHAIRGDRDAAFAWLERAADQRDSGIARVKVDPMFRSLHGDPRFAALLRRLNFPD